MSTRFLISSFLAAPALLLGAGLALAHEKETHAHDAGPLVEAVRAANARFSDVAVATREGYSAIPCTNGTDGGSMGVHYVNKDLLADEAVYVSKPEAVLYEPGSDGKMSLVGVEYVTTKGPAQLEGQLFSFTGSPNRYGLPAFYELHVWAWRTNPKGQFADMNPDVSCAFAPAPTN